MNNREFSRFYNERREARKVIPLLPPVRRASVWDWARLGLAIVGFVATAWWVFQ